VVLGLQGVAVLGRAGAHASKQLAAMLVSVYEIYVSIPTKIERSLREHGSHDEHGGDPQPKPAKARTSWS